MRSQPPSGQPPRRQASAAPNPDAFDAVAFTRDEMRRGTPVEDIVRVLDRVGHAQYARELQASQGRGLGTGIVDGVLGGLSRPIAAAAGTAVQKLSGDPRATGEIFSQLRGDVENQQTVARGAQPGRYLAGNVAGGVVGAMTNPAARAVTARLPFNQATVLGRAGNTALAAGTQTGAASLANTGEDLTTAAGLQRAGLDALITGGIGAAAGGVISPVAELAGAGARAVGRRAADLAPAGMRQVAGRAADAVASRAGALAEGAEDGFNTAYDRVRQIVTGNALPRAPRGARVPAVPVNPGGARVLGRLQAQGTSIPALRQAAAAADEPDMLAEVIGEKGVRDLSTANILGNRAPDEVRQLLDERAADEAARWQRQLARLMQGEIRDPDAFEQQVLAAAKQTADGLREAASDLPVPDGAMASVLREVEALRQLGVDVWRGGRMIDPSLPEELTDQLTVGNVHKLRIALDDLIDWSGSRGSSAEYLAQTRLKALRNQLDGLAKQAGGDSFKKADEIWSTAFKAAEAFRQGMTEAPRATSSAAVQAMRTGTRDPAQFGRGVASARLSEIERLRDGMGGGIQNPFAAAMGSPLRRDVTRAGMPSDEAMEEAQRLAQAGANRLRTRNEVLGNSATARRAADVAEAAGGVANPFEVADAVANPGRAAASGLSRLWQPVGRRLLGDEMDAMVPYLTAGAPGARYTREEALKQLEAMLPALQSQWARQLLGRSAAARAGTQTATGAR